MTDQPGTDLTPAYAAAMPAPQGGALPTTLEWSALERMANFLADSDLVPHKLKRRPSDIGVILLAAREYGIPPLMALSKLPVVNGTPAPMGELMVALVVRAGHKITAKVKNADGSLYRPGVDELTEATYGECVTRRADEEPDEADVLTFALKEAIEAGLVQRLEAGKAIAPDKDGKPTPWQLYTPNMLRWRAVANACRLRFPDVLLGLSYLPEELGAVVDAEGRPIIDVEAGARAAAAKPASLAAREAQDAADRLPTANDPRVLANVLEWAKAQGIDDQLVDYAGARVTLAEALTSRGEWLKANVVDVPQESPQAPQSPPTVAAPTEASAAPASPSAAATAPPAATSGDTPSPSAAATAPAAAAEAFPEAALELVRRTAVETDAATVRAEWQPAKAAGHLELVIPVDYVPTRVVEEGLDLDNAVTVGAYLMAVGRRLADGRGPLVPLDEPDPTSGDADQAARPEAYGLTAEDEPVIEDPPAEPGPLRQAMADTRRDLDPMTLEPTDPPAPA